jgi:hypothetical protein
VLALPGASAAIAGTSIASIAALAIPIAGIAAAVIGIVAGFIGRGCGNACIDAAKREQIYELAADMLNALAKNGYLPPQVASAMMMSLIQGAQQAEAQLGTKQSENGAINAAKVITSEAQGVLTYSVPLKSPDIAGVQSAISSQGGGGWYPDSVAAAQQLTMQIYQQYAVSIPPAPTSGQTSTATTPLQKGGGMVTATFLPPSFPSWVLWAGAGAILLLFVMGD